MTDINFTLFDTAIGCCGLAWGERGIVGVWLPEKDAARTRARVLRRLPAATESAPPSHLRAAVRSITALLGGEPTDLADIELDLSAVPEFNRSVYEVARSIPPGETLTYGQIATRLGDRLLARDVGAALGRNPFPIVVPCHRVLAAGGKTGGFSAPGGVATKLKMLSIERASAGAAPSLFADLPLAARPAASR